MWIIMQFTRRYAAFKDLDMWGLLPNVSYAPDLRLPFNIMYVLEVKDRKCHDRAKVEMPWFVKR